MKYTNINSLWASTLLETLSAAGVECVCLTPGSRNTPLTLAAHDNPSLTVLSHLDERASAYFGVGYARQTRKPAVLVSTSGTAAAEFHPAVLEAYHDRLPMILVTADRPPELLESGANQTINQQGLYGPATRWSPRIPEPEADSRKLRSLKVLANRAYHRSTLTVPGPVHLNVPFRKPLEPGKEKQKRLKSLDESSNNTGPRFLEETLSNGTDGYLRVVEALKTSTRPILFSGPNALDQTPSSQLIRFGRQHGIPILADPLSGDRYGPGSDGKLPLSEYEHTLPLLEAGGVAPPDLVLRLGDPPNASNRLMDFLDELEATQITISDRFEYTDSSFRTSIAIKTSPEDLFSKLLEEELDLTVDQSWSSHLRKLDEVCRDTKRSFFRNCSSLSEAAVTMKFFRKLPEEAKIFIANSTPIRDVIQFCSSFKKVLTLHANRGTSGIDGQISTTAGIGWTIEEQVYGLIGDLASIHDMNGFLHFLRHSIDASIVVINNDGGGIFHRLPVEAFDPPFTELVKTPHGQTLQAIAEQFEAEYRSVENESDLEPALNWAVESGDGLKITEIQTNAERSQRDREAFRDKLESSITDLSFSN